MNETRYPLPPGPEPSSLDEAEEDVLAYLDGDMSPELRAAFERRVADDPRLDALLAEHRAVDRLLDGWALGTGTPAPEPVVGGAAASRLVQSIRIRVALEARRRTFVRWAMAAGLLVAASIVAWRSMDGQPSGDGPDTLDGPNIASPEAPEAPVSGPTDEGSASGVSTVDGERVATAGAEFAEVPEGLLENLDVLQSIAAEGAELSDDLVYLVLETPSSGPLDTGLFDFFLEEELAPSF